MIEYNVESLREQFPELKKYPDSVLYPLFHVAFRLWTGQLKESHITTDVRINPKTMWDYEVVIGGKIIDVYPKLEFADIDAEGEDKKEIMLCVMGSFHIKGDKNSTEKASGNFREFIERQKLEELVAQTKEMIKDTLDGKYALNLPRKHSFRENGESRNLYGL